MSQMSRKDVDQECSLNTISHFFNIYIYDEK